MIYAKKLVTVSKRGTIIDGAIVIKDKKIADLGTYETMRTKYPNLPQIDESENIITPALVDCHTHLLEFAPNSLFPITKQTQLHAANTLFLKALLSGITALGEQICGHPDSVFAIEEYKNHVKSLPLDISFATTSISIGFKSLAHFSSVTGSQILSKSDLTNDELITKMAQKNEFPGENLFINATPANFTSDEVPKAGEIIYTLDELTRIVQIFHNHKRRIGVHVAGIAGIELCLKAGVDVLHHAHGITNRQIELASKQNVEIVATPLGGTHLEPNSPDNILNLVNNNINVSIATDAYLPAYPDVYWLPFEKEKLQGPDTLMQIAQPSMRILKKHNYNENQILALITANPAKILGKSEQFGQLKKGMYANLLVTTGLPGLEIIDAEKIKRVYYQGKEVIHRRIG